MTEHLCDVAYDIQSGHVCRTHQYREVHWRQCSHTSTELHTDMVVQSDLDLGLTLHHHSWQQHRNLTLSITTSETSKQGLVDRKPGEKGWRKNAL